VFPKFYEHAFWARAGGLAVIAIPLLKTNVVWQRIYRITREIRQRGNLGSSDRLLSISRVGR